MLVLCDVSQMSPMFENIFMFSFDWSTKTELYVFFWTQSCYFIEIHKHQTYLSFLPSLIFHMQCVCAVKHV